jgi:hypothetical protein
MRDDKRIILKKGRNEEGFEGGDREIEGLYTCGIGNG